MGSDVYFAGILYSTGRISMRGPECNDAGNEESDRGRGDFPGREKNTVIKGRIGEKYICILTLRVRKKENTGRRSIMW